jgi:hypothetical protein
MILDDIIAAIIAIFHAIAEAAAIAIEPLVNGFAIVVEGLVGLFVAGFKLGRLGRDKERSRGAMVAAIITWLMLLTCIAWFFILPKVTNRSITFVAVDGQSLPCAGVVIHAKSGDIHRRTDLSGVLVIPRFATNAITLKDSRYVEQTWNRTEIPSTIVVQRTVLGSLSTPSQTASASPC